MWETAQRLDSYRSESEDRAAILPLSGDTVALLVADGVGGQANGGPAATQAIRLAIEILQNASPKQWADARFYERLLYTIDAALSEDTDSGQTTLVVVCLTPQRIVGASVGDSEAWWIESTQQYRAITSGSRKPYLGTGAAIPVSFQLPLPKTGTLLVGSDGLFRYTYPEWILPAIAESVETLEVVASSISQLPRSSSGILYDDLALLLARKAPA